MVTNIPIQVIWNSLKSNKTYGLVKQLYNSNLSANIYAIYKYPENLHGISVSFNQLFKIRYIFIFRTKGVGYFNNK